MRQFCRLLSQDDSNGWHLHLHNIALQHIKRGQKGDVCTDVMRLDIELPKRNFIDFIFPKKEYRLKNFFTYSGLVKRQCELENVLKHDFKNIDLKIEMWYKAHKPMKTNWDGEAVYS